MEENRLAGLGETLDIYTDLYLSWTLPWVCRLLEREGTPRSESTIEDLDDAGSLGVAATVAAFERWEAYRRRMSAFMRSFDLLLSPVLAYPAYPHGAYADADPCFSYLTSLSLLGWPVVVVPVSQTGEGLPVGVQIAAKPWQEPLALAAAAYLESTLGGWKRPPL